MATRSTIAIEREDGTVAQVYCHWDGYLSNNGRLLFQFYNEPSRIEQLIELGDISSLKPEIGEKHDFDWFFKKDGITDEMKNIYENMWTTFYGRDRGEEGTEARVYKDFSEYNTKANFEEYDYVFRSGVWYVQEHGARWKRLDLALQAEDVLEDM